MPTPKRPLVRALPILSALLAAPLLSSAGPARTAPLRLSAANPGLGSVLPAIQLASPRIAPSVSGLDASAALPALAAIQGAAAIVPSGGQAIDAVVERAAQPLKAVAEANLSFEGAADAGQALEMALTGAGGADAGGNTGDAAAASAFEGRIVARYGGIEGVVGARWAWRRQTPRVEIAFSSPEALAAANAAGLLSENFEGQPVLGMLSFSAALDQQRLFEERIQARFRFIEGVTHVSWVRTQETADVVVQFGSRQALEKARAQGLIPERFEGRPVRAGLVAERAPEASLLFERRVEARFGAIEGVTRARAVSSPTTSAVEVAFSSREAFEKAQAAGLLPERFEGRTLLVVFPGGARLAAAVPAPAKDPSLAARSFAPVAYRAPIVGAAWFAGLDVALAWIAGAVTGLGPFAWVGVLGVLAAVQIVAGGAAIAASAPGSRGRGLAVSALGGGMAAAMMAWLVWSYIGSHLG